MRESLWYVVIAEPQRESWASAGLVQAGFDTYIPMLQRDIRHHRTKKMVQRKFPLFNRYVFIRDPGNWMRVRAQPYVRGVIANAKQEPLGIPEIQIARLMQSEASGDFNESSAAAGLTKKQNIEAMRRRFRAGVEARVTGDHWMGGYYATVESVTAKETIMAVVEIFGRGTVMEFDPSNLELA